MFPDKVIYPPNTPENSIVLQEASTQNPYCQGGSLESWRETIGCWSEGNSRLTLALCASLASPLLELAGLESGGFNWIGSSSTGKTTALLAAGSVWGKGSSSDGYVLSWRSTDNALEAVAALHSDTALCLDELSQAPSGVVAKAAYMLGNGRGKSRANIKGNARPTKNWRVMILSTGEQSLDEKLRVEGLRSNAGQAVRLIDIPGDAGFDMGLFENLHGYKSPQTFADAIKSAASLNYGYIALEFISKIIEHRDIFNNIHDVISSVSVDMAGKEADSQVLRVSKRFALCLVAGELATKWGIFPWQPGSATTSIKSCFKSWLNYRGGIGATEDIQIIRQVTLFIEQHGNSRFQPLISIDTDIYHNRAGFKETKDNRTIYYVLPESFSNELCKGFDKQKAAKVLRSAGILIPENSQRLQAKPPRDLPGWGRKRCYVLSFDMNNADEITL